MCLFLNGGGAAFASVGHYSYPRKHIIPFFFKLGSNYIA